jgi:hypothetical protein
VTNTLRLKRALKGLLALTILVIALPYAWSPIYEFPEPRHFSGSHLFNPYAALQGTWQRANFHAHGRAWLGITNGTQPDLDVVKRYRDLGYSVPGVSNYQWIAAHHGVPTIPIYEHGFNIIKQHQLAIGARQVEWFDFLVGQATSHEQYLIDRLAGKSALVALAHPATRDAYTEADLQRLTRYHLIEIVNGPFAVPAIWDAALSAGRPVWAIGNDDTHDLDDARRTAAAWTMIDAATPTLEHVVEALRAGRSYAVQRVGALGAAGVTTLDSLQVEDETTLAVSLRGAASNISFIGQNGVVRKVVKDVTEARYDMVEGDTYIRTVVESPQTILYLNPVVRYDGATGPAMPRATVDVAATWTYRGSIGLGCVLLATARVWRRRRTAPATARVARVEVLGSRL